MVMPGMAEDQMEVRGGKHGPASAALLMRGGAVSDHQVGSQEQAVSPLAELVEFSSGAIGGSSVAEFGGAGADLELTGLMANSWAHMELGRREQRKQYSQEEENSFRQDLFSNICEDELYQDQDISYNSQSNAGEQSSPLSWV